MHTDAERLIISFGRLTAPSTIVDKVTASFTSLTRRAIPRFRNRPKYMVLKRRLDAFIGVRLVTNALLLPYSGIKMLNVSIC